MLLRYFCAHLEVKSDVMKKRLFACIFLLAACVIVLILSGIEFFKSEEVEGYIRQYREEQIVELYLQNIQEKSRNERTQTETETVEEMEESEGSTAPVEQVNLNYSDDN